MTLQRNAGVLLHIVPENFQVLPDWHLFSIEMIKTVAKTQSKIDSFEHFSNLKNFTI